MKKLILILPVLILFSCSVQKRKYQKGYYVSWHKTKSDQKEQSNPLSLKPKGKTKTVIVEEETATIKTENKSALASGDNSLVGLEFKKHAHLLLPSDSCDVLVFKDGSEIKAKVMEIGLNEIKYKKCESPDGPNYISRKTEIFMIKYANGTREVIKTEQHEVQQPAVTHYKLNKTKRENHPLALTSLVLGALSIAVAYITVLLVSVGLGPAILLLPIAIALAAVIAGKTAINKINMQPELYKGKGMAVPGLIMGIVILSIFALVLLLAWVLAI